MTLEETFALGLKDKGARIGVAVSGGSDSMALLHLAVQSAARNESTIFCATVDHGLRAAAKDECKAVARSAHALQVSHDILKWRWDGSGNLQAKAREGRYQALAQWGRRLGLDRILLGHTQDDVAETFFMRLGRGSGLKGLARMDIERVIDGQSFLRPLLSISRVDLRAYLDSRGASWVEDPSNEDQSFDRVRARELLRDSGVTASRVAQTATRLAAADEALEEYAGKAARMITRLQGRSLVLDAVGLEQLPEEIKGRILSAFIMWQGRSTYPPRRETLDMAMSEARSGKASTLGGCLLLPHKGSIIVAREPAAAPEQVGRSWDGCQINPLPEGAMVGPLQSEGLRQSDDWRGAGLPRAALQAEPAIWRGKDVLGVPALQENPDWKLSFALAPPYLVS